MRLVGSKSWRSTFDVPEAPHIALFIRDALRLSTAEDDALPHLLGGVPDCSSLIDDQRRSHTALLWQSWWRALTESGPVQGARGEPGEGDFGDTARELGQEARAWFYEHKRPQVPPLRDPLRDWEITRDAAEAAAMNLGVEPGEVHADTWLLVVEGVWWQRPAPGQLLYSPAVRDNKTQFFELLRAAFLSSV